MYVRVLIKNSNSLELVYLILELEFIQTLGVINLTNYLLLFLFSKKNHLVDKQKSKNKLVKLWLSS
jgi:hypothetical protein